jgi:hypothetical protein
MMETNSQYLRWFHELERELWRFYALFGDLCGRCARRTLRESAAGQRQKRDQWCCCMIDNQVHDNWETLNPLQCRHDRGWYEKLEPLPLGRMPGNGPCPALGPTGCRISQLRPITCTTQLCVKMLRVLKRLGLYDGATDFAMQIEDILTLPAILPVLYGSTRRKNETVSLADVDRYRQSIRDIRGRMAALDATRRQAAIDAELPPDASGVP